MTEKQVETERERKKRLVKEAQAAMAEHRRKMESDSQYRARCNRLAGEIDKMLCGWRHDAGED